MPTKPLQGTLKDKRVIVESSGPASRLIQKGFGRKVEGGVELSLIEALFLMEKEKMKLESPGGSVDCSRLMEGLDQGRLLQYKVFKDLRERGYVVKTGFKFGAHFRVYDRGVYPTGGHSRYLVHVITEGESFEMPEISRAVRLAQSVKKTLILAVVDREGDITYYNLERVTL